MAEVEDTSSASRGASRSSSAKMLIFCSMFSGPFSWTNSTPSSASATPAATETRAAAPSGSAARPSRASACSSLRIRPGAAASVSACGSVSRTIQPARAKIAAQARPIRPAPTMATCRSVVISTFSQPQHLSPEVEVVAQRLRRPLMNDPAALERYRGIRQRQRQVEVVVDDDDGDFFAQAVEGLEQLLDHGRREPLERLVQQQHPHVAGQRARDRDHLLLAAGKIIRRAVEPLADSRKVFVDTL